MTSGGGALATAVFAVGTAGGALPGRAVFDGAVVLIWRCAAPRKCSEEAMSWGGRAQLLPYLML